MTRERAILLYALVTSASIDVGRVIFDHYMHSVRAKQGGILFPSLIISLCTLNGMAWANNEEKAAPMKPIDEVLIADFLGLVPPNKRSFASTRAGSSSSASRTRNPTLHARLDRMDRVLEYHGEHLDYQNELLLQQRKYQVTSTQFLHDYLQRMTLQQGGDGSGYPTMLVYPDLPIAPVWVEGNVEEEDDDDEEQEEDDE